MEIESKKQVHKGDIINWLIQQFGFTSYLEYNKFDGASYYDEIICTSKEIAYLPENSYLDSVRIKRLLDLAKEAEFDDILSLHQLQERYSESRRNQKFDIIFFDPVHVRPDVDLALKILPRLLNPGGVLVVHDCNPENIAVTTLKRRPGSWVGETYKAFVLFRHFNRNQAVTVAEDFGVGLIWNQNLNLAYSLHFDLHFDDFAADRAEYIGLMDWPTFLSKTQEREVSVLFQSLPPSKQIKLTPKLLDVAAQVELPHRQATQNTFFECQIFWRSVGQAFSEARSALHRVSYITQEQILRFMLPDSVGPISQLRIDFTDQLIAAKLHAICLFDHKQEQVWNWDGSGDIFAGLSNMRLFQSSESSPQTYLLANTLDPYFLLVLPPELDIQIDSGWQLQLQLSPLPAYLKLLLDELSEPELKAAPAGQQVLSKQQTELLAQIEEVENKTARIQQRIAKLDDFLLQWRAAPV